MPYKILSYINIIKIQKKSLLKVVFIWVVYICFFQQSIKQEQNTDIWTFWISELVPVFFKTHFKVLLSNQSKVLFFVWQWFLDQNPTGFLLRFSLFFCFKSFNQLLPKIILQKYLKQTPGGVKNSNLLKIGRYN